MKKTTRISQLRLDEIDRRILSALQQDGRLTLADLSQKVGLSPSPCHRRVRQLEDRGVIERYVAVINQRSVGLPVSVFIHQAGKPARGVTAEICKGDRAVAGGSRMLPDDGQRDYLLRVVVADLAAYEVFLKTKLTRLNGIDAIESSFALEQVKYTHTLPLRSVAGD
jgi:Lrp/AsnC family leucine-responsive transcriptional regulator